MIGRDTIGKVKKHSGFSIIVILTIVFAYPQMEGISPFDPGNYCSCAVDLLRGELNFSNFYCNRLVSYLPIAIAIKLFGFNGFYLTLVTLFELVLLITVVYLALQKYNREIALITCAIIGFAPLMLELSGTLFGDIMVALTANLCILWIWYTRFQSANPNQIAAGLLLSIMWYVALLAKESAVYYLVPILIVFIGDKKRKQFNPFWNTAIITGIVIGVLLLSVYVIKTGNLFHRLQLVEGVPNSFRNYAPTSWLMILTRVTILPLKFLIENTSYYIIFLAGLLQLFSKSENDSERFFKMYMVSLVTLWWVGTQSLSSWKPILLEDRVWLPLMVPMAINAAHVFYSIPNGNAARYANWPTRIILIIFGAGILIAGYISKEKILGAASPMESILFRMGVLIFLFLSIFHGKRVLRFIELAGERIQYLIELTGKGIQYFITLFKRRYVVVLLLLLPIGFHIHTVIWKNPRDNNYLAEQEMINTVRNTGQPATIICERSVYGNRGIYFGFDPQVEQQIHFIDWNTISVSQLEELAGKQPVYLLITKDRMLWYKYKSYLSLEMKLFIPLNETLPSFVSTPELYWELAKQSSRAELYTYKRASTYRKE